jgi:hypothetical protein
MVNSSGYRRMVVPCCLLMNGCFLFVDLVFVDVVMIVLEA